MLLCPTEEVCSRQSPQRNRILYLLYIFFISPLYLLYMSFIFVISPLYLLYIFFIGRVQTSLLSFSPLAAERRKVNRPASPLKAPAL